MMAESRDEDSARPTGATHRGWELFVTAMGLWLARKDNEWISSGSRADIVELIDGVEKFCSADIHD